MATASENTVLVEIVTAANLGGIEQAKASLLGFNAATLALAATIGIAYTVGKAAVDNYEAQTKANNDLASAIADRNALQGQANDPKAIADAEKAQTALVKAQQALGITEDGLATKRVLSKKDLDEIRLKNDAVTKAENDLVAANAKVSQGQQAQRYDTAVLQQQVRDFIQTNKGYLDSQTAAIDGFASFVREGVPAQDLTKAMTAAMNIAAVEGISLTDAVSLLQSAEAGRATGLRKLVGIQLENVSATATQADKTRIAADNLNLVSKAYDKGYQVLTPYQVSQHNLNNDWQNFTAQIGPGVTQTLTDLTNAADAGVGILTIFDDLLVKIGNDSALFTKLINLPIIGGPGALQQLAGVLGAARGAVSSALAPTGSFGIKGPAPLSPTTVNVTVNGATDPQTTARVVTRALRSGQQT